MRGRREPSGERDREIVAFWEGVSRRGQQADLNQTKQ